MNTLINMSEKTQYYIALEEKSGAHNYHPIPVVLEKGEGVFVYDVNGERRRGVHARAGRTRHAAVLPQQKASRRVGVRGA